MGLISDGSSMNRELVMGKIKMRLSRRMGTYFVSALVACAICATAQTDPGAVAVPQAAAERDGQHDFDFELGSWKIHLKRRLHPLTGSNTWAEFDGTSVTRKVWDGRAQIEEFETDGPGGHIEGLTLRLYNSQTHQWNLYWANRKKGTMEAPQVGQFKNGQGEFYGMDTLDGKAILVRFIWSKTNSNMPHFEQAFSDDGGKTWEVNWITGQTRVSNPEHAGILGPTVVSEA
jgi:hypothetical protein